MIIEVKEGSIQKIVKEDGKIFLDIKDVRYCKYCHNIKDISDFTENPLSDTGYEYRCKACKSKNRKEKLTKRKIDIKVKSKDILGRLNIDKIVKESK